MTGRMRICCGLVLVAVLVPLGCQSGPSVRKAKSPGSLFAAWHASALGKDSLSPRTQQTVRQLNLEDAYRHDPQQAFAALHKLAVKDGDKDVLFALAEISYELGRKLENKKSTEAIAYFYLCSGYAYHFLFGGKSEQEPFKNAPAASGSLVPKLELGNEMSTPGSHVTKLELGNAMSGEVAFDPRFRLACDLYNNGLAKCIAAAQKVGRLDPRQQLHLPTADGGIFTLSITHHGFAWHPEEFGPLLFCSDYEVVGMANQFRSYGLGVPLIGTRVAAKNAAPGNAFYPKETSFPVTAFFRFAGTVADLGERRAGRLELYNPLAHNKIHIQDRTVPLETDLTTPLAYFLSRSDLHGVDIAGFFRADSVEERTGIYMFEPYQPGKIPVVMIHGLWSSPLTWAPLFNELRADPVLNQRYQFWFYLYPTVNPYLATAADLRIRLNGMRKELDPQRKDAAFDQMVLVGHSMGGLVSKLMTQNSGDDYWKLVSPQPFDTVQANAKVKQELQEVFFFEPQPGIKRVIFLGTPHRGSNLAPFPSRLLDKLVRLPKHLIEADGDLVKEAVNPWAVPGSAKKNQPIQTSLDLLSPGSPALVLLSGKSAPPGVRYHSVIGVYHGKGNQSDDGIVLYQSSHVDGVESELLVPGHHVGLHHQPPAVLEVRRILYQHLRELDGGGDIIPVLHLPELP